MRACCRRWGGAPEPDAKNTLFPSFLPTDGKSVFFVMSYEKSRPGRRENVACGRKRVCFFVFLTNLVFKLSFLQEKVAKYYATMTKNSIKSDSWSRMPFLPPFKLDASLCGQT